MSYKHVLRTGCKIFANTQFLGIEGNRSIILYTVKQQGQVICANYVLYNSVAHEKGTVHVTVLKFKLLDLSFFLKVNHGPQWPLSPGQGPLLKRKSSLKNLGPLVVLIMEKTMAVKVISDLRSLQRSRLFQKSLSIERLFYWSNIKAFWLTQTMRASTQGSGFFRRHLPLIWQRGTSQTYKHRLVSSKRTV